MRRTSEIARTIEPEPLQSTPATDGTALLDNLGARVRQARARRGTSRRLLATQSQVSERYLADLETGRGNASVLVLQRIAGALDLSLAELVDERAPPPIELVLLQELLKSLPAPALGRIRRQLQREFGEHHAPRAERVALLGLRGAGKSTLGAKLAIRLACPFVELDREIGSAAGTSLEELFLLYGQSAYRRFERRCLETVVKSHPRCVIATGGSIVSAPDTYALLLSACHTVWLKAAPEEHMSRVIAQGDMRPMAGHAEAMDDLRGILNERGPSYAQADVTLDTSGKDLSTVFEALVAALNTHPINGKE
ncbi:MAG: helix-turn-helix transcriptional regulator [Gammaproteobacteria bacterium]|nr:helix-turn-helix transcriptional regulator [Gammaproteobacteria bacterium]